MRLNERDSLPRSSARPIKDASKIGSKSPLSRMVSAWSESAHHFAASLSSTFLCHHVAKIYERERFALFIED